METKTYTTNLLLKIANLLTKFNNALPPAAAAFLEVTCALFVTKFLE